MSSPINYLKKGQHAEVSKILIEHDPLAPFEFDLRLLSLARSESMKECLVQAFNLRNITIYFP